MKCRYCVPVLSCQRFLNIQSMKTIAVHFTIKKTLQCILYGINVAMHSPSCETKRVSFLLLMIEFFVLQSKRTRNAGSNEIFSGYGLWLNATTDQNWMRDLLRNRTFGPRTRSEHRISIDNITSLSCSLFWCPKRYSFTGLESSFV